MVYVTGDATLPAGIGAQVLVMPFHFLLVAVVGGGLNDEMGWRGFAPRLQSRLNVVTANLVLGSLWACWHLPLWLDPGSSQAATPFGGYAVTVVAQSFVISWLYNASGGSLLVAVVAHSSADVFDGLRLALIDSPGWALPADVLQMTAMVAAAGVLLGATRGSRPEETAAERDDGGGREHAVRAACR